jgi:hypothetical protein
MGNGTGNIIVFEGGSDARACCESCQVETNCVASACVPGNGCEHLVKNMQLQGAPVSNQCPLGIEDYDPMPPGNIPVFIGPCGSG